jgi:hypothetical protein
MASSYPVTGSTLDSQISTGLSTQIVVKVGNETVGAIQQLSIRQNRNLGQVVEVGTDGIIELVHNNATKYTITVNRIVFDRLRLPEAFARGFINIKSQVLPFDILIIDKTAGDIGTEGSVVHRLVNCKFSDLSVAYQAGDYIVKEDATLQCEDISSTLGNTDSNAATGGARGLNYQENTRERETDRGAGGDTLGNGFRGTMDVPNLINQVFNN